jgi:NAD(P)-dependent dehydrogenase (short-subunit alcohol dehydrogenase family)
VKVAHTVATSEDHAETVRQVEALDRQVIDVVADVRDQAALDAAVTQAIEKLGRIDILIANAGIWGWGPFWELTDEEWDDVIGVNLTGVWKSAKAVAPHMLEQKAGSIVITSSVNGFEPGWNYAHYTASKHGVVGLMKTIALELGPYGIRCNCVCPGAIDTPLIRHQESWDRMTGHANATEAEFLDAGYHYNLLRNTTFLDPQVIADAALYLNSPLADKVTGVALPVDAGHLLINGVNADPVRD